MVNARVLLPVLVVAVGMPVAARQNPPAQPEGQRPVFRAGAHYVRVDAYPTGKDGRILEGLTKDDFEIYEDGTPQTVEKAEYVTFDTWTPEAERKDPRTQQEAYDLAADPSWRIFVIVIDPAAYGLRGQYYLRTPLHQFLERNLGPRDLFGLLTTQNQWTDLQLGQTTTVASAVLDSREWLDWGDNIEGRPALNLMDDTDACGMSLKAGRKALDNTYALFEGLVKLLGLIREEKKSIVFVSNGLATPGPSKVQESAGLPFGAPGIPRGPVAHVPRGRPPTGGTSSPVGPAGHGDRIVTPTVEANCTAERMRLANIDFLQRFHDLLKDARRANVAFYPISPAGLQTMPFSERGGVDMDAYHAMNARTDTLLSLASETDGIAIVNTNGFDRGMQRIANDMQSYYVLGYYTTNTKWDGGVRSIKVRLKPKRNTVRARRQYRAPTFEEITAIVAGPPPPGPPTAVEVALRAIDRKASAPDDTRTTLVEKPEAFRSRGRRAPEPAGVLHFARDERLRIEWQVKQTLDRRSVRVLDRAGHPLPVDLPLAEGLVPSALVVELPLSAFARSDYVVELTVGAGAVEERSLVAFRVQ
jgi:VWFA-related protein